MIRSHSQVLALLLLLAIVGGCAARPQLLAYPPFAVEGAVTLDRVDRKALTPAVLQKIVEAHNARAPSAATARWFDSRSRSSELLAEITDGGLVAVHMSREQVDSLVNGAARLELECTRDNQRFRREFSLHHFLLRPQDAGLLLSGNVIFCFGGWKPVHHSRADR